MLSALIKFSIHNKLIILFFVLVNVAFGIYALMNIPIGSVPDITNNQVQILTTSPNLSTQDIEQFITYPVELEMANLPGVQEIRSISKFGISVVTVVFDDAMGNYLPRQLIAEKIKIASSKIPDGFGIPEMGPITTGLGEIYQYTIEVEEEFRDQYSVMDLRTIQDWTIKRQLSGIPGVVEINSWGGYLKQYEVAVNPAALSSFNITLAEVFASLEKNNSIAGGGYIEKGSQTYFIRGEGLIGNFSDIEEIVIDQRNGIPVKIKNVADVRFGYAPRFGAITGNGEGEKVLGQVMMLKGANSNEVIELVKSRVDAIQLILPDGVRINPVLERSELISKTTDTITENLILGCLIVIFIVLLILGNLRSAFVIASVIPLSLFFAISMMYLFGIDANLMSLGAIDFGIIIDGSVIIIEFIAYQMTRRSGEILALAKEDKRKAIDKITFESVDKMMHSAVFGQLIIIIVFIPILLLTGVEGKMFKPMAITFIFALIGVMILCFTYVPVIASLLIKPTPVMPASVKRFEKLENLFKSVLIWAFDRKKLVLMTAISLLMVSSYLFYHSGGEFVPTLDEGDFVIQPILKTGTSLSKTIETTSRIEEIIKNFPEVRQVITRIGAAEVPTDPMSMEETDVIIILKEKGDWISASSKDALADTFKAALMAQIPGVNFEFTQPIEMRFNELISGVKYDLAIKIFGEDLDLLYQKGQQVAELIKTVPGAADISVEKIDRLPQIKIKYNKEKIAQYGLNIYDLNEIISTGFSGKTAGSIFEGEKRFNLVVRFNQDNRSEIENLNALFVPLPGGGQVPLNELATFNYSQGPAKISRENTQRRIVIGVNVRNTDLETVVEEVRSILDTKLKLPPGYTIVYGGQYENLNRARKTLMIAIPIVLLLILLLLYFAFQSLSEALMIYSAIPLSVVGGVFFLWLRDLPFSISAGVGFIALFGIAVLNGIVLIEHFKSLVKLGFTNLKESVILGTTQRLRPVLLTAAAAAFGFLPMALSTSAGAEVQRPLATVVIGGLISATLLTLIILPILYYVVNTKKIRFKLNASLILVFLCLLPGLSLAQNEPLTLDQLIQLAKEKNKGLQSANLEIDRAQALISTAYDLKKTSIFFNYNESNLNIENEQLNQWGIGQEFQLPWAYRAQKKQLQHQVSQKHLEYQIKQTSLVKGISKAFYHLQMLYAQQKEYLFLDSLYDHFHKSASRRFELGQSNYLEVLSAQSRKNEIALQHMQIQKELSIDQLELAKLVQSPDSFQIIQLEIELLQLNLPNQIDHPGISYQKSFITGNENSLKVEKIKLLPAIRMDYFQGYNKTIKSDIYQGFQVSLDVPIFYGAQKATIQASQLKRDQAQMATQDYQLRYQYSLDQLMVTLDQHQETITAYFQVNGTLANALLNTATKNYQNGEIDFFQYAQAINQAILIKINYLNSLNQYNQTVLDINYLIP